MEERWRETVYKKKYKTFKIFDMNEEGEMITAFLIGQWPLLSMENLKSGECEGCGRMKLMLWPLQV